MSRDLWDELEKWEMAINYTGTNQRSEFAYNGLNQRVSVVEKTNGSVTSTRKFVWCGNDMCEFRDANDAVTLLVYRQGQSSGTKYFYTRDHLGSIREMFRTNGTVVARYDYDPWGRSTTLVNTTLPDFNFTGLYRHRPSNLDMAVRRFYDPDLGRWISRDPIAEFGGINLYVYTDNNPPNLSDPLGLRPLTDCEKEALAPYIPKEDLDNADLHDDEVPFWLGKKFAGVTIHNDIYFRPGVYDSSTPGGVALLGHELVHVGQYRNGMSLLSYLWESRRGYENNRYELEAYKKEAEIKKKLSKDKCCTK